ncbi:hypothetical protein [Amphibacillus cookii]|uniref:hypothetical protein n=1 Tax=Amphibacillus cookii TaxID=767787 RepID=UPI00195BBBAC|nr:hypothetical protein [Amphibacillus cookii]MBM7542932.1 hypothetical protein [Amphibacillus cookii]
MNEKEREQYIIEQYQAGEDQMILLFAQWCINHQLDPYVVYQQAYPHQKGLDKLAESMDHTVTLEQSDQIDTSLLIEVLQVYGNDDLAWVVAQYQNNLRKQ